MASGYEERHRVACTVSLRPLFLSPCSAPNDDADYVPTGPLRDRAALPA